MDDVELQSTLSFHFPTASLSIFRRFCRNEHSVARSFSLKIKEVVINQYCDTKVSKRRAAYYSITLGLSLIIPITSPLASYSLPEKLTILRLSSIIYWIDSAFVVRQVATYLQKASLRSNHTPHHRSAASIVSEGTGVMARKSSTAQTGEYPSLCRVKWTYQQMYKQVLCSFFIHGHMMLKTGSLVQTAVCSGTA